MHNTQKQDERSDKYRASPWLPDRDGLSLRYRRADLADLQFQTCLLR